MIKLIGLSALALGFVLHFVEWLYDFKLNGWSFATVLSVAVLIERIHHDHQTRFMLKIIGSKVGVEWQSYLQENGLKRIYPKLLKYSTKPKEKRKTKMNSQNINYATLIPTVLGAAKLILQTFGIEIPDTVVNEIVNGAAAVGTLIGIFMAHRKQVLVQAPAPSDPNQFIQG